MDMEGFFYSLKVSKVRKLGKCALGIRNVSSIEMHKKVLGPTILFIEL